MKNAIILSSSGVSLQELLLASPTISIGQQIDKNKNDKFLECFILSKELYVVGIFVMYFFSYTKLYSNLRSSELKDCCI